MYELTEWVYARQTLELCRRDILVRCTDWSGASVGWREFKTPGRSLTWHVREGDVRSRVLSSMRNAAHVATGHVFLLSQCIRGPDAIARKQSIIYRHRNIIVPNQHPLYTVLELMTSSTPRQCSSGPSTPGKRIWANQQTPAHRLGTARTWCGSPGQQGLRWGC